MPALDTEPTEETVNPLPPAIDPAQKRDLDDQEAEAEPSTRTRPRRKPGGSAATRPETSGELALAPEPKDPAPARKSSTPATETAGLPAMPTIDPAPQARTTELAQGPSGSRLEPGPDPLAEPEPPPAVTASPPPGPPTIPDAPTSNPAPEPVFASTTANPTPVPVVEEYNPFLKAAANEPEPPSPEPGPTVPVPAEPETARRPPRKTWAEVASGDQLPAVAPVPDRPAPSLVKRLIGSTDPRDGALAQCSYDTRLHRLIDFRLPDLDGRPVRFQDFDAEYVLIDFWGTWCGPCLDSIPHLVELQKRYGPKRLRVVGIACEQVEPALRRAKVEDASRKLGINYPVLLSGMDGQPCPVQQMLQIQAYPTAILVDRQGRVLWRNAGSTPAVEERLDKVLAGLTRGETTVRR